MSLERAGNNDGGANSIALAKFLIPEIPKSDLLKFLSGLD